MESGQKYDKLVETTCKIQSERTEETMYFLINDNLNKPENHRIQ